MLAYWLINKSVQFSPVVSNSVTPWTAARQASLSLTISWSLPKFISLHQWCRAAISSSDALFSFCPQIFPSIRDFSNESAVRIRWPKYWSFGFSVSPLGWFSLRLTGLIFLLSKGLSGVFSSTSVWRHQFFGALPSLWSSSYNCVWPLLRATY